ncbi:hypothetical protein [uncultured Microbacterium sp.]|nr:hypothetical protein [uncultured Microbacterium sp.]
MTFDANDAAAGVTGIRRLLLPEDRFGDVAPSRAVAAGDDAA